MDAADQTGKGQTDAGSAADATRYIITRPCLAEGSLSLLKYLQPLFPPDGPLLLQDSRGERFPVTINAGRGLLTGLGELYRAHNMGVNDVLLITRSAEREYTVACVVKPHARPQAGPDRPAPLFGEKAVTEKRVVIHATPHVREVRMERVTAEDRSAPQGRGIQGKSGPDRTEQGRTEQHRTGGEQPGHDGPRLDQTQPGHVQDAQPEQVRLAAPAQEAPTVELPTPAAPASTVATDVLPVTTSNRLPDRETPEAGTERPSTVQVQATQAQAAPQARIAPLDSLTARMQQHPAPPIRLPSGRPAAALNPHPPIQFNFPAQNSIPTQDSGGRTAAQAGKARTSPLPEPAQPPSAQTQAAQTQAAQTLAAQVQAPQAQVSTHPARTERVQARPGQNSPVQNNTDQTAQMQTAEDQLAALARLTGYGCEHLGHGVVRLRADLGPHGYSVLIATTPQALSTPAWNESCDYMALLTPETERPQGIPRFTHAALAALLEHARLAPLTPIDLRGYWNTGSFDQESVDSVAELVSAYLAQRGSFSHVLLTLAQQPAHSLVSLPRLAERLGSGVNTAELQSILETLSRPPFLALTPLPGGQYYLRSDVPGLLQEFGEYAEGMRRRLRPAPMSATGR